MSIPKNLLPLLLLTITSSSANECGQQSVGTGFSIGGEYSLRGQWPWLVPLFEVNDNKFFCSSSIISDKFLLSGEFELEFNVVF